MDGKTSRRNIGDRPIAKPSYPLPSIFSRRQRSELPTRPEASAPPKQRAHFYQKGTSPSGSPIYGFVITEEKVDRQVRSDR